jgi:hypothetical protein
LETELNDWCELLVHTTASDGLPEIVFTGAVQRSTICQRNPCQINKATSLGLDVWLYELDRYGAAAADRLVPLLSEEEGERAGRYRVPVMARRYITRQGVLRELLASYTGLTAKQLEFVRGPYGKPYVTCSQLANQISFSVSHSHGLALYAVTK